MRVLWLVRRDLAADPGGDTVQLIETARALARRGVTVDFCDAPEPAFAGYDCVHLFHLDRLWENEARCRRLRAEKQPAVLSPIYWSSEAYDRNGRAGIQRACVRLLGRRCFADLRLFARWAAACCRRGWRRPPPGFRASASCVLRAVSVILPNSRAEQELIERSFGCRRPAVIIPNAVDPVRFNPPAAPWPDGREGVLSVGRIEPRKNQRALIRALAGTGVPLAIAGAPGPGNAAYYRRCRREAGSAVRFLGPMEPAALAGIYRAARVHACVSWYETPGLASLEAASCGCAIVATPGGCTREYFEDGAVYCEPESPASIRQAVETALSRGPSAALAARIAGEFTWDAAAEKTLEAYVLARAAQSPR